MSAATSQTWPCWLDLPAPIPPLCRPWFIEKSWCALRPLSAAQWRAVLQAVNTAGANLQFKRQGPTVRQRKPDAMWWQACMAATLHACLSHLACSALRPAQTAVGRVRANATAFPWRNALFCFQTAKRFKMASEAGEVRAAMKQLQAALRPIFREEVRFAVRASSLKLPLGQTLSWRAAARSVAPHARAPLLCMHCPLTTLACACLISTHSHRRHRTSTIPMRTWLPTRCRLTMDLTWAGCNASSGVLTRMNISTPTRWPSRRGAQSRAIGCICKGHFHDVNKLVSRDGNSMSRCGMHGCCQTLLQGRATRYNGGRHSAPCDPPPKNS